jgi:hypothetical protein
MYSVYFVVDELKVRSKHGKELSRLRMFQYIPVCRYQRKGQRRATRHRECKVVSVLEILLVSGKSSREVSPNSRQLSNGKRSRVRKRRSFVHVGNIHNHLSSSCPVILSVVPAGNMRITLTLNRYSPCCRGDRIEYVR